MALNEDEDQTVPSAASGEVSRIIQVNRGDGNENAASEGMEKRLPLLTSSCPGWICFVEKTHPEAIPYLSTVKSPQQVMGSLVKSCTARSGAVANAAQEQRQETEQDVAMDISSSGVVSLGATTVEEASAKEVGSSVRTTPRVYHLTIMPCPDKKLEASRKDFEAKVDGGSADVDCVLTTNELLTWLEEEEDTDTNAATTTTTTPPSITTDTAATTPTITARNDASTASLSSAFQRLSQLDEWLMHSPPHAPSKYRSGSSGLLEYVFRSMAKDRFGVGLDDGSPLPYKQVRNRDFQTVALAIDGKTVLNCAAVYGFRNIQSIIRQLKKGKCPYDFVEVMACPGGCLNGGGQPAAPLVAFSESEDGVAAVEPGAIATQRAKDAHLVEVVKKHESLIVQAPEKDSVAEIVDKEWLRAAEGIITTNQLRGKVLHTRYHAVPKMESGLGQSW